MKKFFNRPQTTGPQTTIVAVIADTHINSTVALCPRRVELDDGGFYEPSKLQLWLYDKWQEFWQIVEDQRKEYKATRVITYVVGDAMEGQHHGITSIISANRADQQKMASKIFDIPAKVSDTMIFLRGTEAHSGRASFTEELLAADFDNTLHNDNRATWSDWKGSIEGVRFHIKHHRRMNNLPWTMGGAANRLAAKLIYQFASDEHKPNIVLRAHGHQVDTSSDFHKVNHNIKVFFCPAYKGIGEFVKRIDDGNPRAHIGGWIFTCCAGEYQERLVFYQPKENEWQAI